MQTHSFAQARAQLAQALRDVEANNEPLLISRRGRAAGVLMSCRQFQRLTGEPSGLADRINRWRVAHLAPDFGKGQTDPFANLRQSSSGRDFVW